MLIHNAWTVILKVVLEKKFKKYSSEQKLEMSLEHLSFS